MLANAWVGIDPGASGAIAVVSGDMVNVTDMPIVKVKRGTKTISRVDGAALAAHLETIAKCYTVQQVTMELVGAMPRQGLSSTFNFGHNTGVAHGVACAVFKTTPVLVAASVWKPTMGVTKDKESSRVKAAVMFPEWASYWPLAKHDGRAEAVLIAEYGRQTAG